MCVFLQQSNDALQPISQLGFTFHAIFCLNSKCMVCKLQMGKGAKNKCAVNVLLNSSHCRVHVLQKKFVRCMSSANCSSGGVGKSLRCERGDPPYWLVTAKMHKIMPIFHTKMDLICGRHFASEWWPASLCWSSNCCFVWRPHRRLL